MLLPSHNNQVPKSAAVNDNTVAHEIFATVFNKQSRHQDQSHKQNVQGVEQMMAKLCGKSLCLAAGSEAIKTLKPKSPAAALVPADCSWETSQKAMQPRIWPHS